MEESEESVIDLLIPCIGSSITAIQETDDAVFFHLNDGQHISITVLDDGGFLIDLQPSSFH